MLFNIFLIFQQTCPHIHKGIKNRSKWPYILIYIYIYLLCLCYVYMLMGQNRGKSTDSPSDSVIFYEFDTVYIIWRSSIKICTVSFLVQDLNFGKILVNFRFFCLDILRTFHGLSLECPRTVHRTFHGHYQESPNTAVILHISYLRLSK